MKKSFSMLLLATLAAIPLAFADPPADPHADPHADQPPTPPGDATTLETVTVTGDQPGPGMWKVSKGDHVLWILTTVYPLPKNMTWESKQVDEVIAQSQEVMANVTGDPEISFFHKITLLPSLMSAEKNPDGKTLKDVLSPADYDRWTTLKSKYIGRDSGVERKRPMLAAQELNKKAMEKLNLAGNNMVWDKVEAAAKKNRVRIVEPKASIPVDDPGQLIRDFKTTTGDLDAKCLSTTMSRFENDMHLMQERANAWAVGDMQTLKSSPIQQVRDRCADAIRANDRLNSTINAAINKMFDTWTAEAERALDKNTSTLAVIPLENLLADTKEFKGPLVRLREKGYTIEEPE
jgi:uncharacterized protein YbaP (TraB family)